MNNNIIRREDFLDKINIKPSSDNTVYIHPLINYHEESIIKKNDSYILPQLIDNIITVKKNNTIDNDIKLNIDTVTESTSTDKSVENINPLLYFTSPINSNNFLEIVFGISNLYQLNQWINLIDNSEIKLLEFVLNLYWKNYYNKIDEDMETFIIINKKIFKKFFDKNIDNSIIILMINRLIKNNYGKKIKYISKIKKYLIKYI